MAPGVAFVPETSPVKEKPANERDIVMRIPVAKINDNILFFIFIIRSFQSMQRGECIVS